MKNNEEDNIEERITNMLEEVLNSDSDSGGEITQPNFETNKLNNKPPVIMLNNVKLDNIETEKSIAMDNLAGSMLMRLSPKAIPKKLSTQTELISTHLSLSNNSPREHISNNDVNSQR